MELWPPWCFTVVLGLLLLGAIVKLLRLWRKRKSGLLLTVSTVVPLSLLLLVVAQGCEAHTPLLLSPDGKHVARVVLLESLLPFGGAKVIVRRKNDLSWTNAFVGGGYFEQTDEGDAIEYPYAEWLDATHLVIHLHEERLQAREGCASVADGIAVRCQFDNW